jgi:hypothetical protein
MTIELGVLAVIGIFLIKIIFDAGGFYRSTNKTLKILTEKVDFAIDNHLKTLDVNILLITHKFKTIETEIKELREYVHKINGTNKGGEKNNDIKLF